MVDGYIEVLDQQDRDRTYRADILGEVCGVCTMST